MTEDPSRHPAAGGGPDDPSYLLDLLARSPLLPEPRLRHHWQHLMPWLDLAERYALAGILLEAEHALQPPPSGAASYGGPQRAPASGAASHGEGQRGRR